MHGDIDKVLPDDRGGDRLHFRAARTSDRARRSTKDPSLLEKRHVAAADNSRSSSPSSGRHGVSAMNSNGTQPAGSECHVPRRSTTISTCRALDTSANSGATIRRGDPEPMAREDHLAVDFASRWGGGRHLAIGIASRRRDGDVIRGSSNADRPATIVDVTAELASGWPARRDGAPDRRRGAARRRRGGPREPPEVERDATGPADFRGETGARSSSAVDSSERARGSPRHCAKNTATSCERRPDPVRNGVRARPRLARRRT